MGAWQKELLDIVALTQDRRALKDMSFLDEESWTRATGLELEMDKVLASLLHRFVVSLLGAWIDYTSSVELPLPDAAA
eukprot:1928305-Amphidinium_carterae.2